MKSYKAICFDCFVHSDLIKFSIVITEAPGQVFATKMAKLTPSRSDNFDIRWQSVITLSIWPLPGPEVIKLFSYSTQLSLKFFLLINIKMPTIVGILIFISRKNFILSSALQEKSLNCWYLIFYKRNKLHSQLSWAWKKFYNLGARVCQSCLIVTSHSANSEKTVKMQKYKKC